jgi:hypothetical protein
MVIGVFIDGPLHSEIKPLSHAMDLFKCPIPERITICDCNNENIIDSYTKPCEVFTYYCIAKGSGVAIYSKHKNGIDALKLGLKHWIATNFRNEKIFYYCRDRRAWE